jgi:hypothetical protein
MNVTNSVAFENMNEHNDYEQSHKLKIQNNRNNMNFNKFGDPPQKIDFYPEALDELEQFEMIEQQLKEKHEIPAKQKSMLEVNSSMSTAGEGQRTQRGHLL